MSDQSYNHLPQIIAAFSRELAQAVEESAALVEGEIKKSMGDEKHGLIYPRGGKEHQASAPGEAPAIDTGALVNDFAISKESAYTRKIGTTQAQAAALEFGRVDGRIKPRPFMRPAAAKKKAAVKKLILSALQRAQGAK